MKTIMVQIDHATLTSNQCHALRNLNAMYLVDDTLHIEKIDNYDVNRGSDELVTYHVSVDDESPTFEGEAFFREDFLCGIMDILDDYK